MKLYSTNHPDKLYDLSFAVLNGLAPDGGLFMPEGIPVLSKQFWADFYSLSFTDVCYHIAHEFLSPDVPEKHISEIINKAITFPAPLVALDTQISILELFHGPSLAFKDFGAQFMAQLMSYFNRNADRELVILVATSGDTGGAVAAGFHNVPGIKVVILYPKGKVSKLQEKQLTTFGGNITALEIDGTFDDCQSLVKQAFQDNSLTSLIRLSSANSINISRLIPQSFYYFEAIRQIGPSNNPVVFSVPSGNFGNLTAGLIAKQMGLPIHHFVASTNINDVVPHYLETGDFLPRASVKTISNAMDVGNPSNFSRMLSLFSSTWNNMKNQITGYSFNDEQTQSAIRKVFEEFHYIIDPHAAVGFLGIKTYLQGNPGKNGVVLGTAHPSKFKDTIDQALHQNTALHPKLKALENKSSEPIPLSSDYQQLYAYLLDHHVS